MSTPLFEFPAPQSTLRRFELRAKRSFGQNFLTDKKQVGRIAGLLGPEPGTVIEIGAGLGGLTACLLEQRHQVKAIERDRDLVRVLCELGQEAIRAQHLEVIEADAKTTDFRALFAGSPKPHFLTGNLPYNLTGALLRRTMDLASELNSAVFLVQNEVAARLSAAAATSNYGALSVFAQAAFKIEKAFVVKPGSFHPVPKVDSAVVRLTPLTPPLAEETETFRTLVGLAFEQRRKTLRNAWKGACDANSEQLATAAKDAGISLDARGETLSVLDFQRMCVKIDAQLAPGLRGSSL